MRMGEVDTDPLRCGDIGTFGLCMMWLVIEELLTWTAVLRLSPLGHASILRPWCTDM